MYVCVCANFYFSVVAALKAGWLVGVERGGELREQLINAIRNRRKGERKRSFKRCGWCARGKRGGGSRKGFLFNYVLLCIYSWKMFSRKGLKDFSLHPLFS